MGGAIVEGLLKGDYVKNEDICVSDASRRAVERFAQSGANITTENHVAAMGGDIVFVVVKPWLVEQVIHSIKDSLDYDKQLLVVVAAVDVDSPVVIDGGGVCAEHARTDGIGLARALVFLYEQLCVGGYANCHEGRCHE